MPDRLTALTGSLAAGVLVVAVVGSFTVKDNPASVKVGTGTSTTTTTVANHITPGGVGTTSTTKPGGKGSTTTTTKAGTTTTTGAGQTTTTTGSTSSTTASGPSTTVVVGRPGPGTPAAAGTYDEAQTGGYTIFDQTNPEPPRGTLVVDKPSANGTQVWHRYVYSGNPPADNTVRFSGGGAVLISETVQNPSKPGTPVTCTFSPPIPLPSTPSSVGTSFQSTGNCGSMTLHVNGSVKSSSLKGLPDGTTVRVYVVDSTVKISGTGFSSTSGGTEEDWYSPDIRLDVHSYTTLNVTYSGIGFSSYSNSNLQSSKPR